VIFRRRQPREITEAIAYARCHGERGPTILRVSKRPPFELPERRRGFPVSVRGEALRQAFAAKLDEREQPEPRLRG
jgi:hypothetical protein